MERMLPAHPRHHAFSLTELVIVIGILIVLISLLMPALARMQESALIANCGSNLRQIGQAAHAYRADHKRFPAAAGMPDPFKSPLDPGKPIYDALDPYLPPASPVYQCPGDTHQVHARCVAASPRKLGTSYFYWGPDSQTFPTDSLARNVILWEYGGDSLHGLIKDPFHRGGHFLYWDGSVEFKKE
jgi:type II secretory pathway pseudopilin PulG